MISVNPKSNKWRPNNMNPIMSENTTSKTQTINEHGEVVENGVPIGPTGSVGPRGCSIAKESGGKMINKITETAIAKLNKCCDEMRKNGTVGPQGPQGPNELKGKKFDCSIENILFMFQRNLFDVLDLKDEVKTNKVIKMLSKCSAELFCMHMDLNVIWVDKDE